MLRQLREKTTDWIKESGMSEKELTALSGKPETINMTDYDVKPFYFLEITGKKDQSTKRLQTVVDFLDILDELTMTTSISFTIQLQKDLP